ncbi:MAG TPA: cyclic pyranopterin monophosphate synthase MoaC [Anaeromyxobacter sp.]|nr:cyclic pyranopterin monophosphate synthase MoaC [Anaeromyxobacter sp.]
MTIALTLLVYAACAGTAGARLLARIRWAVRAPLLAIVTYLAAAWSVVAAAGLAGVLAAKRTPDLVPLCHPIALSGVEVEVEVQPAALAVQATVRTVDRTGVEMEALAAVAAACLTIYDMLKRYERGMRIEALELIEKRGGRSGHWLRGPRALPGPRAGRRSRSRRTPAAPRPPTARPAPAGRRPAAGPAGRRR